MASAQRPGRRHRGRHRSFPREKEIGDFQLHGSNLVRLTISKRLEKEPFPSDVGDQVTVDLIVQEDGYQYLEVHAKDPTQFFDLED